MITLLHGDAREMLTTLEAESVQTVVTSPPYWGLRKYSDDPREIGNEPTPADYVASLVAVFDQVKRVLRDDGTLWLNLGDAYANDTKWGGKTSGKHAGRLQGTTYIGRNRTQTGLPSKSLIGLPWRVAFALQDAGWILRSDIIWAKPNCMPESVTDRPTRAHEYLFLFAKQARYFYDADAIRESASASTIERWGSDAPPRKNASPQGLKVAGVRGEQFMGLNPAGRNKRTVWTIATHPYNEAHFATMPEALIEPCILAGSSAQACETCGAAWGRRREKIAEGERREVDRGYPGNPQASGGASWKPVEYADLGFAPRCACEVNTGSARSTVLDPFAGSGTVARVAERFQRNAILIDLNQAYIELQERRTDGVQVELFV